jgi:hypothetical protein
MVGEPRTGAYWVKNIDLIAWSLETKKKVCVITDSDLVVIVYSGISQPQYIQLSEFSPNADDIVICITLTEFTMRRCFTSMKTSFKLKTFLMIFMQRITVALTSQEHTWFLSRVNAVRDLRNEPLIDLVTLRDALSMWNPCNTEIAQSKTIHGFIDGFYTEKHRQLTAEELLPLVSDVRSKGGHNLITLKSIRVAIST